MQSPLEVSRDMSKYTVINISPLSVDESKPGVHPGEYQVAPSKDGVPGLLIVEDGMQSFYRGEGKSFQSIIPAEKLAISVCRDFRDSMHVKGNSVGLFCVEGEWSHDTLETAMSMRKSYSNSREIRISGWRNRSK